MRESRDSRSPSCSHSPLRHRRRSKPRTHPRRPRMPRASKAAEAPSSRRRALAPLPITEGFRIRLQTFVAPEARVGSGHVTLVRPELSARATVPVNDKAVMRVTMRLAENRYRFHGDVWGSEGPARGRDRPRSGDRRPRPALRPARARGCLPSQPRHALARGAGGVGGGRSRLRRFTLGRRRLRLGSRRGWRDRDRLRDPEALAPRARRVVANSTRRRRCRRGPTLVAALAADRSLHAAHARARPPGRVRAHARLRGLSRGLSLDRSLPADRPRSARRSVVPGSPRPGGRRLRMEALELVASGARGRRDRRSAASACTRRISATLLSRSGDPSGYLEVRIELRL